MQYNTTSLCEDWPNWQRKVTITLPTPFPSCPFSLFPHHSVTIRHSAAVCWLADSAKTVATATVMLRFSPVGCTKKLRREILEMRFCQKWKNFLVCFTIWLREVRKVINLLWLRIFLILQTILFRQRYSATTVSRLHHCKATVNVWFIQVYHTIFR